MMININIFAKNNYKMKLKPHILLLLLLNNCVIPCLAQGNWVKTTIPINGSVAEPMNDYIMSRVSVVHYDGLGRVKSNVQVAAGSGEYDIADYVTYDSLGRESKKWLPIRTANCSGDFPSGFERLAQNFHNDTNPYTETTYDGTHYNRRSVEQGPGQDWRQYESNVKHYYLLNGNLGESWTDTNGLIDCDISCVNFFVDENGMLRRKFEYSPGTLHIEVTIDEQENGSAIFTDKFGRKILQRQCVGNDFADTYWVFDIFGRLRYVISPVAAKILTNQSSSENEAIFGTLCNADAIERYCYVYGYDNRDRCITKKMPGQAEQQFVYDKLNRVIFSQDGEQRMKNEWSVRKYDSQQRIAVEGRAVIANATRESLQQQWGNTTIIETYNPNLDYEGCLLYSNSCGISNFTADKAYYYDDYSHWGTIMPIPVDASYPRGDLYNAKGMFTGMATTDFNGSVYVSIMTYDQKGNVVMTSERDIYGQNNMVTTFMAYDHTGNLTDKKRLTQLLAEQQVMNSHNEQWEYDYDAWGRNTQVRHRYGNNNWRTLGMYSYDQLGRKADCYYGNSNFNHITYNYNLRGWLTNINGRYYSQTLYYNSTALGNGHYRRFDGSISATSETVMNRLGHNQYYNRTIDYDELDRVTMVKVNGFPQYDEQYAYDLNGNVTSITRGDINNGGIAFDRLCFNYEGNQIQSVTDSATLDLYLGEVAQVVSGNYLYAFDYDLDGRLTRDDSRGISRITYNSLGLPSWIQLDADHDIHITYQSDGTKQQELMREFYIATVMRINRVTGDTTWVDQRKVRSVARRFFGDMVMETGKPPRIYNEVGYIDIFNNGDSVVYYFYECDYLGNVRVVVDEYGNIKHSVNYYASGIPATDFSAFVDNHLHTGKQWMSFGGLDWYDNNARWYDPIFMRFTTPDPLQEKYPHLSPYSYCANNPVRYMDFSGNDWYATEDGVIMWDKYVTSKENIPDGATYLGKTYKGLVVYEYDEVLDPYNPENGVGIRVVFGYNTDNDNDNFDNMNWFQTVKDNPQSRLSNPFVDADKLYLNDDNKITLKNYAAENKYDSDVYFMDVPSRFKYTESQWDAELSLVKNANVSPQIILTLTYGFSVGKDNKSHAKSIILRSSPSEKHKKMFNDSIK